MITFDSLTLKAFLHENLSFFIGARIQKIQQPTRRELVLTLRNIAETRKFYINITPDMYHLCFTKINFDIPKAPPMFCMLLRKYIENAKIIKVQQPQYERILEIFVDTYNEIGDKIELCLAIELMGKHSNIVLYNCDTDVIIGCAHNIGAEKSREREMAGGLPYVYPPKQLKTDILNYYGELKNIDLSEKFLGFSKAFANQCKDVPLSKLQDYIKLIRISPVIDEDYKEFCLFSQLLNGTLKSNVNEMIDDYFSYHQEKALLKTMKHKLNSTINVKYKKILSSLEKMEKQLSKETKGDKYRLFGDLIMGNLYQFKDFASKIEVVNWNTNKKIEISLDNTKTLKDNANKYYKLYNKSKRSIEKLNELVSNLKQQKIYFEQVLYSIEIAQNSNDLSEILFEIEPQNTKQKNEKQGIKQIKIDDFTVFIGKNNKENDYIISKLAKDEDLWFHTKDCAGSHVLLKINNNQTPSDKVILECAKLAKENSKGKNSSKIGVIYTKRKYLKKPPAANLGYVTYKNEQEIIIDARVSS